MRYDEGAMYGRYIEATHRLETLHHMKARYRRTRSYMTNHSVLRDAPLCIEGATSALSIILLPLSLLAFTYFCPDDQTCKSHVLRPRATCRFKTTHRRCFFFSRSTELPQHGTQQHHAAASAAHIVSRLCVSVGVLLTSCRVRDVKFATVLVGDEAARFVVHEELLTYHSLYFRAALRGGFAEAADGSVRLQEAHPVVFEIFVH